MSEPSVNTIAQRIAATLLIVGVVLVYAQVVNFRYSQQADFDEVASNQMVLGGMGATGIDWVTGGTPGYRWQPLTWLLHMAVMSVDSQATLHHAINLLLHLLNVLLMFMILERFAPAPISNALFAGLFAFHPMRAEAVASVTALGEVLAMAFLLMSLFAVLDYKRGPKLSAPLGLALLFALGAVLSAPRFVLVPLAVPMVAVLLSRPEPGTPMKPRSAAWLPFALMSAYGVTKTGAFALAMNGEWGRLGTEALAAIGGVAVLLSQFVWPFGLTVYYDDRNLLLWGSAGALVLTAAAVGAVALRRRAPVTAFGLTLFLVAIPPLVTRTAIDSLQVPIAESYLAITGLIVALAGLMALAPAASRSALVLKPVGAVLVLALAVAAFFQTGHRENSFTFLRHNIAVCEECDTPYRLLGDLYAARTTSFQAIPLYEAAIELNPEEPSHRLALVLAHWNRGNQTEAREELQTLIAQHPDYAPGRRVAEALNE